MSQPDFISKVYRMIQVCPQLINWDNGRIVISSPKDLEAKLPEFFRHGKFASFQVRVARARRRPRPSRALARPRAPAPCSASSTSLGSASDESTGYSTCLPETMYFPMQLRTIFSTR